MRRYAEFDTNKDGVVDEVELREFLSIMRKEGRLRKDITHSPTLLLQKFDWGGNGTLSLQEFSALKDYVVDEDAVDSHDTIRKVLVNSVEQERRLQVMEMRMTRMEVLLAKLAGEPPPLTIELPPLGDDDAVPVHLPDSGRSPKTSISEDATTSPLRGSPTARFRVQQDVDCIDGTFWTTSAEHLARGGSTSSAATTGEVGAAAETTTRQERRDGRKAENGDVDACCRAAAAVPSPSKGVRVSPSISVAEVSSAAEVEISSTLISSTLNDHANGPVERVATLAAADKATDEPLQRFGWA